MTFCLSGTATLMLHCVVWISLSSKQVSDTTFLRLTPLTCTQPPPTRGLGQTSKFAGVLTEDSSRLQENTFVIHWLRDLFLTAFTSRLPLDFTFTYYEVIVIFRIITYGLLKVNTSQMFCCIASRGPTPASAKSAVKPPVAFREDKVSAT